MSIISGEHLNACRHCGSMLHEYYQCPAPGEHDTCGLCGATDGVELWMVAGGELEPRCYTCYEAEAAGGAIAESAAKGER